MSKRSQYHQCIMCRVNSSEPNQSYNRISERMKKTRAVELTGGSLPTSTTAWRYAEDKAKGEITSLALWFRLWTPPRVTFDECVDYINRMRYAGCSGCTVHEWKIMETDRRAQHLRRCVYPFLYIPWPGLRSFIQAAANTRRPSTTQIQPPRL